MERMPPKITENCKSCPDGVRVGVALVSLFYENMFPRVVQASAVQRAELLQEASELLLVSSLCESPGSECLAVAELWKKFIPAVLFSQILAMHVELHEGGGGSPPEITTEVSARLLKAVGVVLREDQRL